jgi:hypothetical protein
LNNLFVNNSIESKLRKVGNSGFINGIVGKPFMSRVSRGKFLIARLNVVGYIEI